MEVFCNCERCQYIREGDRKDENGIADLLIRLWNEAKKQREEEKEAIKHAN